MEDNKGDNQKNGLKEQFRDLKELENWIFGQMFHFASDETGAGMFL